MLKGIIFDYDGVIAQSVKVKSDAFAELYKSYGPEIVREVINYHQNNGGISRFEKIKYFHKNLLDKKILDDELFELSNRFSKLVVEKVVSAPYIPMALEYIMKAYDKYQLFISTGTPLNEMKIILHRKKINHYFTEVFGSPMKKNVHLRNIMKRYNFSPEELIFYGDSTSDLDAAKETGIPFVLIKNKFNKFISKRFDGKILNDFTKLV